MTSILITIITPAFLLINTGDAPRIEKRSGTYTLNLPRQVQALLRSYDSTFVLWRLADYDSIIQMGYEPNQHQLPFAIIGDFNGDGVDDVILDGHDTKVRLILAILSSETGYKVLELDRMGYIACERVWSSLTFVPKGATVEPIGAPPVLLKTDAFE